MFTLTISQPRNPKVCLNFSNSELAKVVAFTISNDYNFFGSVLTLSDANGKILQKIDA